MTNITTNLLSNFYSTYSLFCLRTHKIYLHNESRSAGFPVGLRVGFPGQGSPPPPKLRDNP